MSGKNCGAARRTGRTGRGADLGEGGGGGVATERGDGGGGGGGGGHKRTLLRKRGLLSIRCRRSDAVDQMHELYINVYYSN